MDTSIVTALAVLAGALIGGLTTLASPWLTQRYQAMRARTANEIAKREALYGELSTRRRAWGSTPSNGNSAAWAN